jgi:hypothetical protein
MANRKRQPGNRPKFGMIAIMATIARLGFVLSHPNKMKQKKPF